jgi:hypothetical protein
MSTPRLESHTDPTPKHPAALARALGWADEAGAGSDCANALAWVQTLKARVKELKDDYRARRQALATRWLNAIWHVGEARGSHDAEKGPSSRDPNRHARPPAARSTLSARSADCNARRTEAVSVRSLLDVVAEFDRFGGASLELVAWELSIEESAVSAAWSRAIADGLLERSGTDEVPGEDTWRLTTLGRRAYEGSDDVST